MGSKDLLFNRVQTIQKSIKGEVVTVFRVEQVRKDVQDVNFFIKDFLRKENNLILPLELQKQLVLDLKSLNENFLKLEEECSSEYKYQLHRRYFEQQISHIQGLVICLQISIENALSHPAPEAISLHQSIQVAWTRLKKFIQRITYHDYPSYFPYFTFNTDDFRRQAQQIHESLIPTSETLIHTDRFGHMEYRWKVKELLLVNQFFDKLQQLENQQSELLLQWIQSGSKASLPENLQHRTFHTIQKLEEKLQLHNPHVEHSLSSQAFVLSPYEYSDFKSRFYEARLRIELQQLVVNHRYDLQQQQRNTSETPLANLQRVITQIQSEMQQHAQSLDRIPALISELQSIRLGITTTTIHLGNTLEQAYRSRFNADNFVVITQDLQKDVKALLEQLRQAQQQFKELRFTYPKARPFQHLMERYQSFTLKQIDHASEAFDNYMRVIKSEEARVKNFEVTEAEAIHKILQHLYDQSTSIGMASGPLHGLVKNMSLLCEQTQQTYQLYEQIVTELPESDEGCAEYLEKMLALLEVPEYDVLQLMESIWILTQDLEWLMDEIILKGIHEYQRYEINTKSLLETLQLRALKQTKPTKRKPKDQANLLPTETSGDSTKKETSSKKASRANTSAYAPFSPDIMKTLKQLCRKVNSERTLHVLEVLERPHSFFTYLNHLEKDYEPNSPHTENYYFDDVLQSQTVKDFLFSFLKMKVMPYGFFDAHGQKLEYDEEGQEFKKEGEPFIQFTRGTTETPMSLFKRLLRIILGYDDPDTLNRSEHSRVIDLLKEDHILTEEEQQVFKETLSSLK